MTSIRRDDTTSKEDKILQCLKFKKDLTLCYCTQYTSAPEQLSAVVKQSSCLEIMRVESLECQITGLISFN